MSRADRLKLKLLDVGIAGRTAGQLLHHSVYEFRYLSTHPHQPWLGLLLPPEPPTYQDGDLFPVLDQNLPEGDLYLRLRQLFPKQPLSPMRLLSLIGANGIGRLSFREPGATDPVLPPVLSRQALLSTPFTPALFDELVRAYMSTGTGISGIQPKIMVPEKATVPIPSLIVKAGSDAYPGLAANEYLCLSAAKRAGLRVPDIDLSDDGQLLLVDRFDIAPDGERLGFEDVASLMGLRVRDLLSDRKYHGSYQRVAELLRAIRLPAESLAQFFEQVALTVMVRNGDGHLKNFGVLYRSPDDIWLSPVFDVVTTAMYRYAQFQGGPELEDRTLALKLFAGRHSTKAYPNTPELLKFGREVCGVKHPDRVLDRLAQGMAETLTAAEQDARIPSPTLAAMRPLWESGMAYAMEARGLRR